jgi:uncharacterized protein Yka (UPF0111/DUF47 family)
MSTIWSAFGRFFGPSHNDDFARLIGRLGDIAVECAAHFRKTSGRDLEAIVAFERQADTVCDEVHELLDNSFILRFDVQDAMELTDEIDNVIDGMRKVAIHLDIYGGQVKDLSGDPERLIELGEQAVLLVRDLAHMLSAPRLDLARARDLADKVSAIETEADKVTAAAERRLVERYAPAGANRLEFLAWTKLYELLEVVTDDAKHVAKLILSLARKES